MKRDLSRGLSEEILACIRKDTKMEAAQELAVDAEQDEFYVIEIEGYVPELMPISFRRAKRAYTRRMKEIKCPHCSGIYEMVDAEAKVKVHNKPQKAGVICDTFRPCRICDRAVGIKYV